MTHEKQREIVNGFTIRILADDDHDRNIADSCDPTWAALHCFHRRYRMPRVDSLPSADDCDGWADMRERIEAKGFQAFNVSMIDHSGTSVKIGSFHDPWDSGQIGFAVVPADVAPDVALERATALVREWDDYMTGNVWGFDVTDAHGQHIESCWGFVGDEGAKQAMVEARAAAEAEFDRRLTDESTATGEDG